MSFDWAVKLDQFWQPEDYIYTKKKNKEVQNHVEVMSFFFNS